MGLPAINLLCLPEGVLCTVFSLVSFEDRATVLPLVCKRVHQALSSGSNAWMEVEWSIQLDSPHSVTRCAAFFAWLLPRAARLCSLNIVVERRAAQLHLSPEAAGLLQAVLAAARLSLMHLKLIVPNVLDLEAWLPQMPHLASVFLAAHGLHIGGPLEGSIPRLKQVELFTPEDLPPSFAEGCALPPAITRLVMVPAPPRIPDCVLRLRHLEYLDIGGGYFEEGALDTALPHLTSLTALALDRSSLFRVPQQLSTLASLRVLSLHQALPDAAFLQSHSFSVLTCLAALTCLSISGCGLQMVPSAVVQLTTLKVLHTEGALVSMCVGPYLRSLEVLSIDWQVLFRNPSPLLAHMAALRRLCISIAYLPTMPAWELATLRGAGEALDAIAHHPTLVSVALVVADGEVAALSVQLVQLLVRLAQCKPGLDVKVVPASAFFLTDGIGIGEGL